VTVVAAGSRTLSPQVARLRTIRRVLLATLVLNWAVAAAKVGCGAPNSLAGMVADGLHSLGDGAGNLVALAGAWFASRPADDDHPLGHKKFETLFALGIAALLFLAAGNVLWGAARRLWSPVTPEVTPGSFLIMGLTLVVNLAVAAWEGRVGRRLQSDVLRADAIHTRVDVLISLTVVATLAGIRLGAPWLDVAAAAVIGLVVAAGGAGIVRDCAAVLCDAGVDRRDEIRAALDGLPGVLDYHNLHATGHPDDVRVHLHVHIPKTASVAEAHAVSHAVADALRRRVPGVTQVWVHIEPGT